MRAISFIVGVAAFWLATPANAEVEIILQDSFIATYANRATIETGFIVDKAHKKPNSPAKDGDMHIAGRDNKAILPMVAEIMNAKEATGAVDRVHDEEGQNHALVVVGAWRLWNEHAGDSVFVQGSAVKKATTTNPDHAFEIHPVTSFDGIDVSDTLHPIAGFQEKDPEKAFTAYENLRSEISHSGSTTSIVSSMGGYNYVKFQMVLSEKPKRVSDGALAFAEVHDLDGELLVRKRRMVFVGGTPPADAVKSADGGACFVVLGIPRIDLALVKWRVEHAQQRPGVLKWNLPYEIIVAGVYDEDCAGEDE